MRNSWFPVLFCLCVLLTSTSSAEVPSRVDEKLGNQLPLDASLRSVDGRDVTLGTVLRPNRSTVLNFVYYRCPGACTLLLNGLTKAISDTQFTLGAHYDIVTISIDPNEDPALAAGKRDTYVSTLTRSDLSQDRWQFFTAEKDVIRTLTDATGFRYEYDPDTMQYDHPSVLIFLNDSGEVVRYLYGSYFQPRNLDLAIIESGDGSVGSLAQRVETWFHDFGGPEVGRRYALNHTRIAFVLLICMLLGACMLWFAAARWRQRTH